jgi:hypothetical protein
MRRAYYRSHSIAVWPVRGSLGIPETGDRRPWPRSIVPSERRRSNMHSYSRIPIANFSLRVGRTVFALGSRVDNAAGVEYSARNVRDGRSKFSRSGSFIFSSAATSRRSGPEIGPADSFGYAFSALSLDFDSLYRKVGTLCCFFFNNFLGVSVDCSSKGDDRRIIYVDGHE